MVYDFSYSSCVQIFYILSPRRMSPLFLVQARVIRDHHNFTLTPLFGGYHLFIISFLSIIFLVGVIITVTQHGP